MAWGGQSTPWQIPQEREKKRLSSPKSTRQLGAPLAQPYLPPPPSQPSCMLPYTPPVPPLATHPLHLRPKKPLPQASTGPPTSPTRQKRIHRFDSLLCEASSSRGRFRLPEQPHTSSLSPFTLDSKPWLSQVLSNPPPHFLPPPPPPTPLSQGERNNRW